MSDADRILAERIRTILKRRRGYSEKRMFGGVAFFINGHMCVAPWDGYLVVRLDRAQHEQTQQEAFVHPMDLTGRVLRGWARVDPQGIQSDLDLKHWIERAVKYARTLPPKE